MWRRVPLVSECRSWLAEENVSSLINTVDVVVAVTAAGSGSRGTGHQLRNWCGCGRRTYFAQTEYAFVLYLMWLIG